MNDKDKQDRAVLIVGILDQLEEMNPDFNTKAVWFSLKDKTNEQLAATLAGIIKVDKLFNKL